MVPMRQTATISGMTNPPAKRSTSMFLVVPAMLLIVLGVYFNWQKWSGATEDDSAVAPSASGSVAAPAIVPRAPSAPDPSRKLRIIPEKVDAGVISLCSPPTVVDLELVNDGKEALKVMGWATTCACLVPQIEAGFSIEPGGSARVPVRIDPLGIGGKSHRLDFRLEGNSRGGSARFDYRIESPIIPMPLLIVRPDREDTTVVDIERIDVEGAPIPEKFRITGIEPPVAKVVDTANDGHVLIEVDFKAIDEIAAGAAPGEKMFDWRVRGADRRWQSMQLRIATDCPGCPELLVRVRNR